MRLPGAVLGAEEFWGLAPGAAQKATRVWETGRVPCRKKNMKELFLFALIFASFGDSLFAQDAPGLPGKPMRVRLVSIDRQVRHGYLYALTDSSLLLSTERLFSRPMDTALRGGLRSFGYREMGHIEFYHQGVVWRSALVGFGIGAATGALLGFLSGDDTGSWFALSAGEKAAGGAILGGGAGMLAGMIIGVAGHHTFYIGGERKKYEQMRRKTIARLGL